MVNRRDLHAALAAAAKGLRDDGQSVRFEERGYRATALLDSLGINTSTTLDPAEGSTLSSGGQPKKSELTVDVPVGLGRFQIVGELGRGGMGRVLEAHDPEIRRNTAIKIMINPKEVSDAQLYRFVAEAQITGQLEHPNIVPIYDMGVTEDGEIYFVMRKVEGRSLADVLGDRLKPFSQHRLLQIFVQVCHAIAYAHSRGVLHRDLKPDNIMVGTFGEVLVMDWGVSRVLSDQTESVILEQLGLDESIPTAPGINSVEVAKTLDGVLIGTPGYMSPEQTMLGTESLDFRADIFSLGTILFEILIGEAAFAHGNRLARMMATVSGPEPDPKELARQNGRDLAEPLAQICRRAIARDREQRYRTVNELSTALEAWLDGSEGRQRAAQHLDQARALWAEHQETTWTESRLRADLGDLEAKTATWAPLEEKGELLSTRAKQQAANARRAVLFGQTVAACERALSHAPNDTKVRSFLASVYWSRLEDAEANLEAETIPFLEGQIRAYDDGAFAERLEGRGLLSIDTTPSGASLSLQQVQREGLIWSLDEPQIIGTTPLKDFSIPMGSYVLTIKSPGMRDTIYPIHITRGRHWKTAEPIPLFRDEEIGADWIYVPAGPFISGGDPNAPGWLPRAELQLEGFFIQKEAVKVSSWVDFLNHLSVDDPDEAWMRVPRQQSSKTAQAGQYLERPKEGEQYVVPEVDHDGDRWDPNWPVFGVNWFDAIAYRDFVRATAMVDVDLPLEAQWEKAARGVDGRLFPWGDDFDACLCNCRSHWPGRSQPTPSASHSHDQSVYGVSDCSGSMRQWCAEEEFDGNKELRPIRCGSWGAPTPDCRIASRYGYGPWVVFADFGLRLVRPLPQSKSSQDTEE